MRYNLLRVSLCLAALALTTACSNNEDPLAKAAKAKAGQYPIRTHHIDDNNNPMFTNRLILQNSPYLLQHAHNPVDWWSWGEAAFAAAQQQDKPILLSIGYSTCHWCHVMERESFENLEIAEFINTHFIPVKVDREEHPDVDEVYLNAVQMLSGKVGWPLNVVMTPDAEPFFGGTYFAPEAFLSVLQKINTTWLQRRPAITEQAGRIKTALLALNKSSAQARTIDDEAITAAQQRILESLTATSRRQQPGFPREPEMQFLLTQAIGELNQSLLDVLQTRLLSIAAGGIHDQVGGGFHRYTVDPNWQIPHFEKMLYNQAQLGELFARLSRYSDNPDIKAIAESTLDFMLSDMAAPNGGFYAAIDAESDGGEGRYYLWSHQELTDLLTPAEIAIAQSVLGISKNGNFEGRNVLQNRFDIDATSKTSLKEILNKLSDARRKRAKPTTDTKIITAWNSLAISALVSGYRATQNTDYLSAARNTANTLWKASYSARTGLARTLPNGDVRVSGTLEDYAYFSRALLDLYDEENDPKWLDRAKTIVTRMTEDFHDPNNGGFFISNRNDQKRLVVSLMTARDDAISSGNSVAAQTLARLFHRTGDIKYRDLARGVIALFSQKMLSKPESLSGMLLAASFLNQYELNSTQYIARSKVRVVSKSINGTLRIELDIAPGWHVNAHQTLGKYLIPTQLKANLNSCADLSDPSFPEGKRLKLGFQADELIVYEGQALITAALRSKTAASDCYFVGAELTIQACSDEVCLSPETIAIRQPYTAK